MITYGGFRFACEKCIGGHRPATCKHVDRPLKEIRNKGRPSTQCDHCKSRRSEKCGSHVKCVC
ncbi:copper fist DNA binding domain-containing protein, partial [Hyaloraphidium curvatum]